MNPHHGYTGRREARARPHPEPLRRHCVGCQRVDRDPWMHAIWCPQWQVRESQFSGA